MKSLRIFLLFVFLISFVGCQKNSEPLELNIFGPETNGLHSSISLTSTRLRQGESTTASVIIQNVLHENVTIKAVPMFALYNSQNFQCYLSYFDVTKTQEANLLQSSKQHPEVTLTLSPKEEIKRDIDITRLGWLSPVDSRMATKTFFQVVAKDTYTLRFELDLANGGKIQSNAVRIVVE